MIFNKNNIAQDMLLDITPSQEAMYLMYKFGLHKQMAQIPTSFTIDSDLDFSILQQAFDIEIQRNDSLRLRFIKDKGSVKQYFCNSYSYKVPTKYFDSVEQQEKFFSQDAPKTVRFLKDETYRIYFFKTKGAGCGIYSNFSHLIMDAMGIVIFYYDLLKVYYAIANGEQLPEALDSYEQAIVDELKKASDEKKNKRHEEFLREYFLKHGEPFYAAVHGMDFLNKYRKKKKDPSIRVPMAYNPLYDKCDFAVHHIDAESAEKIMNFCRQNQISPESVFQFGLRAHCSAVNERINDVSFMSVCNRRTGVKRKNMSGCFAQPLIMRTVIPEESTFLEALEQITDVRMNLYRHADYPYTKARDMFLELFNLGPIQGANSMMFSWIPLPEGDEKFKISDFRTYNLERYFTPVYTIVMPSANDGGINIYYMYRVKLITEEQIKAFHNNILTATIKGISNPDITVKEILDCLI